MAVFEIKDGIQYYQGRPIDNRFMGYDNVELISILIPVGSTQQVFPFQDEPQLRGMEIQAIIAFSENDYPTSFNYPGVALPTTAQFQAAALKAYESQKSDMDGATFKDGLKYIPLIMLHPIINGADPYVFQIPYTALNRIQWLKSGIVFNAVQSFGAAVVFEFAVCYSSKVPSDT